MTYTELYQLHEKAGLPPPCPSCFERYEARMLEPQDILPLRGSALDAFSYRSKEKICKRCEKMESLMRMANMDVDLAFAPAYNDWAEGIRLAKGLLWGTTHYPTGGLDEWIEYQHKRDTIDFYGKED